MSKSQIVILFGRSGCGKGTQAELLIKDFGFEYLGSGALLRERIAKEDFTGQKLKEVLDQGGLVPTPIMFRIWAEKVEEMRENIDKNGIIIDGSPRALLEAELMDHAFEWYGWDNVKVVLLDISEEEAFNRLIKRQRDDDNPNAIKERLAYFKKDVQPAIDYYQGQDRLIKIDGSKSIKDVYQDIKKAIQ